MTNNAQVNLQVTNTTKTQLVLALLRNMTQLVSQGTITMHNQIVVTNNTMHKPTSSD